MKATGQRGAFLQPKRYGRTEAGQYQIWPYHGSRLEIQTLASEFDALGFLYDVEEGFGETARLYLRVERNIGAIEAPVNLWEFFGQDAEKDVLEADVYTGITATLSRKNIEIIRDALDGKYPNGRDTLVQGDFTDGNPTNAFILYKLMKTGVRSTPVGVPVLRHTQTVSNNWTIPAALTNVRRIISTSTLLVIEDVPAGLLFNLPNNVPASFAEISVAYGWLKKYPTVQQVAMRKWQLVQEWEYGLWATALFGTPL